MAVTGELSCQRRESFPSYENLPDAGWLSAQYVCCHPGLDHGCDADLQTLIDVKDTSQIDCEIQGKCAGIFRTSNGSR
jgi:hypothetical protein